MSRTKIGLAANRPSATNRRGQRYVARDTNQEWVSDGEEWIETTATGGGSTAPLQVDELYTKSLFAAGGIYENGGVDNALGPQWSGSLLEGAIPWVITVENPSEDNPMLASVDVFLPGLTLQPQGGVSKTYGYARVATVQAKDALTNTVDNAQHGDAEQTVVSNPARGFDGWIQPAVVLLSWEIPAGETHTIEIDDQLNLDWDATFDFFAVPMTYGARAHVRGREIV